jgi:hypothetical protein
LQDAILEKPRTQVSSSKTVRSRHYSVAASEVTSTLRVKDCK